MDGKFFQSSLPWGRTNLHSLVWKSPVLCATQKQRSQEEEPLKHPILEHQTPSFLISLCLATPHPKPSLCLQQPILCNCSIVLPLPKGPRLCRVPSTRLPFQLRLSKLVRRGASGKAFRLPSPQKLSEPLNFGKLLSQPTTNFSKK